MTDLTNKIALVTGANGGIGRATALRLAREGAAVAVHYRSNRENAEALVAEIKAAGGTAEAFHADLAERDQIRQLFAEVDARMGGIDIVAHLAAQGLFKPLALIEDEEIDHLLNVNVRAGVHVLQEAARRVREGGRIITVSVAGTVMPVPGASINNSSRAAVDQIVQVLAKELGSKAITANVVALGMIDTDALVAVVPENLRQQVAAQAPLGRLGRPEEVAGTIAFLAGEDAGYISGQVIRVSGALI